MSQISDRPARVVPRSDRPSTSYSKSIADAVSPETRAHAAEAAGALLTKLQLAAAVALKGAQ
ncbi:hypothetical protein ACIRQF_30820 [Streptomyces sp. NPDC101191]|uniref:hypothetical protein n=1 Tax=Streptomyces sp. NPDC101191 TaxID=3366126 RepID=UPI003806A800